MNRVKVKCEVESSKGDDFEDIGNRDLILVESHWNSSDFIHIQVGKEKRVVTGHELITAIQNAGRAG